MAKATAEFQVVKFGYLAFNHDLINAVVRKDRRPEKWTKILRESFARDGWNAQLGIIGVFGPDSPIWKNNNAYAETLKDTYNRRKARYDELQKSTDEADKIRLAVFRELYCEKDVLIRPRWVAATCNGRGDCYEDAMVMRAMGWKSYGEDILPMEPIGDVPIQVNKFQTESERITYQVLENGKEVGFYEMTSLDKLRSIAFLYENDGLSYVEARRKYPGTVGQKGWLLVALDAAWSEFCNDRFKDEPKRPNLDLVARCSLPSNNPRYIKFESLNDVTKLAELLARSSPDGLLKKNKEVEKKNLALSDEGEETLSYYKACTEDDVERFVTGQDKSSIKPGKVLKKETWESFRNGKNYVLQAVAGAHLGNSTEAVKPLVDNKDAYNKLWSLCEEGKGTDALLAMSLIEHPLFSKFAELVLSNKEIELYEKALLTKPEDKPAESK